MKKISTLFKKDPTDLGRVINEIDPKNQWVIDGESIPTRKYDGTSCAIIDGKLFKRYDVKHGKKVPANAIPCQEPDTITGHWPHWILCDVSDPASKYHLEAFNYVRDCGLPVVDGTYELCGPKIQGNPENFDTHVLVPHGKHIIENLTIAFDELKLYLENNDIEGIVFHHKSGDGRMCKLRKSDFGIKRK